MIIETSNRGKAFERANHYGRFVIDYLPLKLKIFRVAGWPELAETTHMAC